MNIFCCAPQWRIDFILLFLMLGSKILLSSTQLLFRWNDQIEFDRQQTEMRGTIDELKRTVHLKEEFFRRNHHLENCEDLHGQSNVESCKTLVGKYVETVHQVKSELDSLGKALETMELSIFMEGWETSTVAYNLLSRIIITFLIFKVKFKWILIILIFVSPILKFALIATTIQFQHNEALSSIYIDRLRDMIAEAGEPERSLAELQPTWTSQVLAFIVAFPILDHLPDHNVYAEWFIEGGLNGKSYARAGTAFYMIHVVYYILMKSALVEIFKMTKEKEEQKTPEKKKKSEEPKIIFKLNDDPNGLLAACAFGLKETVKAILKREELKINEIVTQLEGFKDCGPLHLAVFTENLSIVQILLDNNQHAINLNAENEEGKTAFEIALDTKNFAMISKFTKCKRFKWKNVKNFSQIVLRFIEKDDFQFAMKLSEDSKALPGETAGFLIASAELAKEINCNNISQEDKMFKEDRLARYKEALKLKLSGKEIDETEKAIEKTDEVHSHFECPICFMIMGKRIYSCTKDHWICQDCLSNSALIECPQCRESYKVAPPRRVFTAERIVRDLKIRMDL